MARVQQGLELPRGYAYGERPLREEIIDELRAASGDVVALVTRNSYGSLVLNAARAMFVDIDLPPQSVGSRLGALFGGRRRSAESERLDHVRTVLRNAGGRTFRVYRTAAGFRVLATDALFDPGSAEAERLMTLLEADPAFVQLCRVQESFRARLTPKPWRCGSKPLRVGYPREQARDEQAFAEWLQRYERECANHATCHFVEEVGSGRVHADVRRILDVHDEMTKATATLPLA